MSVYRVVLRLRLLPLVLVLVAVTAGLTGLSSEGAAHSGPYHKKLYPDRWYQYLSDYGGNYVAWMTLTSNVGYDGPGPFDQTNYNQYITSRLAAWNGTASTIWISNGSYDYSDDVHIIVTNACTIRLGPWVCVPDGVLGQVWLYDELLHECAPSITGLDCHAAHSRPNTWWWAVVVIHHDWLNANYGSIIKQATIAHELGHALGLAHEPTAASGLDGKCGVSEGTVPQSVMDPDCIFSHSQYGPTSFDVCGLNHAYMDPNWGWSGC